MNTHGHWRLAITPLSPVHLGTGQDYEPTGYVIDGGALHAFDSLTALEVLPDNERVRLGRMLEGRPTPDTLRQVQRFFHDNRAALIAIAHQQVRVNATVEAFYGERVGQVAQHEQGGQKVQNRLEIERTAYNPPTGQAILPGSGLKGAIRTALLNAVNDGQPLPAALNHDRQKNQRLQEQLFGYQMNKLEHDPLRLVAVGDASLRDPAGFATQVRFAVNRKKDAVFSGGRELDSQAERQGLYQLLECLPPLAPQAFAGSLTVRDTGGLASPKWPSLRFGYPEIALACNRHYRPLLEAELKLLKSRGFLDNDWAQALDQVLTGPLAQALAQNHAFLLRVGRHSGAEAVTLAGVRNIKILRGRGERPDWLDHAKTVWLASDERLAQRHLLPFGWLLVEPWQEDQDLCPWPASDYDTGISAWKRQVGARQAQLAAELGAARQRERERTEAAAQAAQAAAEHQALLAAKSPEERAIANLGALLDRDQAAGRKEAGGELANALTLALKQAQAEWRGPVCQELADLAEAVYGFIGWPASKKKQERKALIQAVRDRA
jgi:CRISPR-associated protein Csm5